MVFILGKRRMEESAVENLEYLKGQVCGFGVSLYSHAHYMLYMLNSKRFKVENERNKRKIVVLLLRKQAMLR